MQRHLHRRHCKNGIQEPLSPAELDLRMSERLASHTDAVAETLNDLNL
jgi:hypothetical protein